jgi:hypothetical protein
MKIAVLTNEYPPNVYGGAGVHVEYLTREMAELGSGKHQIQVLCFGDQQRDEGNLTVEGVNPDWDLPVQDERHQKFMDTLARDLAMSGSVADADVVLETVSEGVAKRVTEALDVPTIGIGAGRYVDGQVLVVSDVLGLGGESYSLSKQYADLDSAVREAVERYVDDVEAGEFPTAENAFDPIDEDGR